MLQGFPKIYSAIWARIPRVILQVPFARKVARRADLRTGGLAGPRTVLEGFIDPNEDAQGRIWYVDFTSVAYVRLHSESNETVYLNRLASGSSIDGIAFPITGTDSLGDSYGVSANHEDGSDLGWLRLEDETLGEVRVGLGMFQGEISLDPNALEGPFSVALQVE